METPLSHYYGLLWLIWLINDYGEHSGFKEQSELLLASKATPPTTPLPESSHLERLSSGRNLLSPGLPRQFKSSMDTRSPLLTTIAWAFVAKRGLDENYDVKGRSVSSCLSLPLVIRGRLP